MVTDVVSPYQRIQIVDSHDFGRCLYLDGEVQLSEKDEHIFHESLVHPAALLVPDLARVLIVGGGDGGALRETLKHQALRKVDLVELDKTVYEISLEHLVKVHQWCFTDQRVAMHFADGARFISRQHAEYDLIILDLTDPHLSRLPASLWSSRGLQELTQALSGNGVLVTMLPSHDFYPAEFRHHYRQLHRHFQSVRCFFVWIPIFLANLPFALCAKGTLLKRFQSAHVHIDFRTSFLTKEILESLFVYPKHMNRLLRINSYPKSRGMR
jgi:spermidine synthase